MFFYKPIKLTKLRKTLMPLSARIPCKVYSGLALKLLDSLSDNFFIEKLQIGQSVADKDI